MINKKALGLLVLIMALVTAVAACSSPEDVADGQGLVIEHDLGRAQVETAERVVVFDYATLDSLNQMDVDVIGVVKATLPDYLNKYSDDQYEDIGTLFEPDFEKIYSLKPDLILISARQAEVYEELADIAPTVHLAVDAQDYLGSLTENLGTLGEIFGKGDLVAEQVAEIEAGIDQVKEKTLELDKDVLILMANDGALSAYGVNSRFNIIHDEFGFAPADENIEVANHGHNISFEYLVETDPDIIFVIDRAEIAGGSNTAAQVLDNDLVRMTTAYKNDEIYYLNAPVWYTASGGLEGTKIMIEDVMDALD